MNPHTYIVPYLSRLPHIQYINPIAQMRKADSDDVFEFLNCRVQDLMGSHFFSNSETERT